MKTAVLIAGAVGTVYVLLLVLNQVRRARLPRIVEPPTAFVLTTPGKVI